MKEVDKYNVTLPAPPFMVIYRKDEVLFKDRNIMTRVTELGEGLVAGREMGSTLRVNDEKE